MLSESVPDGTPIRLLTLNAHQGFSALRRRHLLAHIRDGLRAAEADLVFLQEVGGDDEPERSASHYELLADQAWPQYAYGRNAVAGSGHQGNALLSKYPILKWQNVDVSIAGAEPRGMLHCLLDVPQAPQPLHAVCVHFGLRESHRRQQLERLLDLIRTDIPAHAPVVIAGDFNDWRGRAHRRFASVPGFSEIHAGAHARPARTFPAWWPWLRLDRIYVRNLHHRPVQMQRHPWSKLSDHAPLAAEVRILSSAAGA